MDLFRLFDVKDIVPLGPPGPSTQVLAALNKGRGAWRSALQSVASHLGSSDEEDTPPPAAKRARTQTPFLGREAPADVGRGAAKGKGASKGKCADKGTADATQAAALLETARVHAAMVKQHKADLADLTKEHKQMLTKLKSEHKV